MGFESTWKQLLGCHAELSCDGASRVGDSAATKHIVDRANRQSLDFLEVRQRPIALAYGRFDVLPVGG
jgi:hypothetical protein